MGAMSWPVCWWQSIQQVPVFQASGTKRHSLLSAQHRCISRKAAQPNMRAGTTLLRGKAANSGCPCPGRPSLSTPAQARVLQLFLGEQKPPWRRRLPTHCTNSPRENLLIHLNFLRLLGITPAHINPILIGGEQTNPLNNSMNKSLSKTSIPSRACRIMGG